MWWNMAAYGVLGEFVPQCWDTSDLVAGLEERIGSRLPAAVREWFTHGGAQRLARAADNTVVVLADLADPALSPFFSSGYLLVETDSQRCCQWVTPIGVNDDDPPVYLIDPDDHAGTSRALYADRFSSYTFACAWDALLWREPGLHTDFDFPFDVGALGQLRIQLSELPSTHGWALNQACDVVYRFDGPAKVAIAVSGATTLWSAIFSRSRLTCEQLAKTVGASI